MLSGKRVLLSIGGGIAAYTHAAAEFVTPLSVSALAGETVYNDLFDLTSEAEMGHIQLSRVADLVLVAPATADLMAKMAMGQASDLATTLLLATDTPVMIAPAMNVRMWDHPATQRNLAILRSDSVRVVGPNEGDMACGEFGPGRMAEPLEIVDAVIAALSAGPLVGKRIIVTSGPTHEPIAPVRYIANRSSGAQGTAIATALRDLGAEVVFITGPAEIAPPDGVVVVPVQTATEMQTAVANAHPADAAVFAAAVADWRVVGASESKIKKQAGALPTLEFAENPDILAEVSQMSEGRPQLVVGFAAETDDVVANATAKRARKGCDWIVANDVSPASGIMGGLENAVTVISESGADVWPRMGKDAEAQQ